jgi:hypothetical protein
MFIYLRMYSIITLFSLAFNAFILPKIPMTSVHGRITCIYIHTYIIIKERQGNVFDIIKYILTSTTGIDVIALNSKIVLAYRNPYKQHMHAYIYNP